MTKFLSTEECDRLIAEAESKRKAERGRDERAIAETAHQLRKFAAALEYLVTQPDEPLDSVAIAVVACIPPVVTQHMEGLHVNEEHARNVKRMAKVLHSLENITEVRIQMSTFSDADPLLAFFRSRFEALIDDLKAARSGMGGSLGDLMRMLDGGRK